MTHFGTIEDRLAPLEAQFAETGRRARSAFTEGRIGWTEGLRLTAAATLLIGPGVALWGRGIGLLLGLTELSRLRVFSSPLGGAHGLGVIVPPTLRRGDTGSLVAELQNRLLALRYPTGPDARGVCNQNIADGRFGVCTEHAVRKFQADSSLVVDGIVGPNTWAALAAATPMFDPVGPSPGAPPRERPATIRMEPVVIEGRVPPAPKAPSATPYIIGGVVAAVVAGGMIAAVARSR